MAELLPHELRRRTKTGRVVSNKMQKTVVVIVESIAASGCTGATLARTTKFRRTTRRTAARSGTW
jgi:ribosomal protein S17